MKPAQVARYFHTIKYLKWKQIFYQVYYVCKRKFSLGPVGNLSFVARPGSRGQAVGRGDLNEPILSNSSGHLSSAFLSWASPAVLVSCLSDEGEFSFHGETGRLDDAGIWNSPHHSKLWLYHLHYFDELTCVDADARGELLHRYIDTWIDHNLPGIGNGWEPYPLSLRLVNWVKWFSNQSVKPEWLVSLGIQADALMQQIEYHILGNHLFVNGKALVFVGTYFTGKRADAWLKKGLQILDREINEQFLADGGHFELSPMYHATMLWDMCDLVHLANQSNQAVLWSRRAHWHVVIERGLHWLSCMTHPDGDIAFFNDAALGIAPTLADLLIYARQLEVPSVCSLGLGPTGLDILSCWAKAQPTNNNNSGISTQWLKESGYCTAHFKQNGKAIVDVANVGPDYQPGHAHADTLSFELSLYGQRFIVNSGTSQYGEDEPRQHQRGTKAHNTVCIDGQNSSDVWAGFRVARRAYPRDLLVREDFIGCSHDGYRRLPGRNIHRREWTFSENSMMVRDMITGRFSEAVAHYYFHPDVRILKIEDESVVCCLPKGQEIWIAFNGGRDVRMESADWHPYFGGSVKNTHLMVHINESQLDTHITWSI